MSDLISRSALIEKIEKRIPHMIPNKDGTHSVSAEMMIKFIGELPAVEAVPVVQGEWVLGDLGEWKCSICSEENCYAYDENLKKFTDFFCPNCGARMKGK